MPREKAQAAPIARPKVAMRRLGADCSVVVTKRGNARGAKGAGHRHELGSTGSYREEPECFSGRRQPSCDGTSDIAVDGAQGNTCFACEIATSRNFIGVGSMSRKTPSLRVSPNPTAVGIVAAVRLAYPITSSASAGVTLGPLRGV